MDISKIARVVIYPAIGIARVGNSPDEYFLGPEIPGQHPIDADDFRDCAGRIKRQAARFRVFAVDEQGEVLGEIDHGHGAEIEWHVQVANKKAGWYDFDLALDIPAAVGDYDTDGNSTPGGLPLLSQRRNRSCQGAARDRLRIEPAAQKIRGVDTNRDGRGYRFDDGEIDGTRVYLGELRTDEAGRLIFLGGHGHSASFNDSNLTTFANNQGWYDDTSDGPVDASVTLPDGRTLQAEGAWVLTAPPNFAVGVQAFSTGYDLLRDVAHRAGLLPAQQPAFYRDIYPMLRHLSVNQWVNAGVAREFGWGSAYDFDHEALLARLADPGDASRPLRQTILESFRNPDFEKMQALAWPPLYGDAVTFNVNSTDPRAWFAVTRLQYVHLGQWARGDFTVDAPPQHRQWHELSPAEQADGLTEAALEETLGGPFHPGCEFTWPMRHRILYDAATPFRIRRRQQAQEDFGIAIDSDIALGEGGPLDGSTAGDLTKWMAVPWQADTSSCLSAYRAYAGEYLPTFWPARVPNDVLTEGDFATLQSSAGAEHKIAVFSASSRKKWLRGYIFDDHGNFLGGNSITDRLHGVEKFTAAWHKAGIVVQKRLEADPQLFPRQVWVETGRHADLDKSAAPAAGKVTQRPAWFEMNPRRLR